MLSHGITIPRESGKSDSASRRSPIYPTDEVRQQGKAQESGGKYEGEGGEMAGVYRRNDG